MGWECELNLKKKQKKTKNYLRIRILVYPLLKEGILF